MFRMLLAFLVTIPLLAQTYRVEAVAGADHAKEGPGLSVLMRTPTAIVAGRDGSFFVTDYSDHRVKKIASNLSVTNVAGDGRCCTGGDGGPALQARVGLPNGLAFDNARNRLYISQPDLGFIRAVDLNTGKISTFAGTGNLQYSDANEGKAATAVSMAPNYIATDQTGNLFVSDTRNWRVYRIDTGTATLRTVAGQGPSPQQEDLTYENTAATRVTLKPERISVSGTKVVFEDRLNLVGVDLANGLYHTIVRARLTTTPLGGTPGNLEGTITPLSGPLFNGSVLAADALFRQIYSFQFEESIGFFKWAAILFRGTGPFAYNAIQSDFTDRILSFAISGANLLAIGQHQLVTRLAGNQLVVAVGGPPKVEEKPLDTYLFTPTGIVFNPAGELVIADDGNNAIRIVNKARSTIRIPKVIGPYDASRAVSGFGQMTPFSVAITASGETAFTGGFSSRGAGTFNVSILSADESRIEPVARFSNPTGICSLPDGSMLVADYGSLTIRRISADRKVFTTVAGNGSKTFVPGAAPLATGMAPYDVACAPDGQAYIADPDNHRIYRFDPVRQTIVSIAGTGERGFNGAGGQATKAQLWNPTGVAVSRRGEIFVAETLIIVRISPSGVLRFVAGSGKFEASGDGGPALAAGMNPTRLVVGPDDAVYFSDDESHRVRRLVEISPATPTPSIDTGGVVSLAAGVRRVAPGGFLSIYGSQLAQQATVNTAPVLPEILGGTQVLLDGKPLALYYVSPNQINAQMPNDQPPGTVEIQAIRADERSNIQTVSVVDAQPDLLTYGGMRAVAINENGMVNGPANTAAPGESLVVYLSGIGVTNPPVRSGSLSPADPLARATGSSSASIGGEPASISYLGLTPGFSGLAQANILVPDRAQSGDRDLVIRLRGVDSNVVKLSIR